MVANIAAHRRGLNPHRSKAPMAAPPTMAGNACPVIAQANMRGQQVTTHAMPIVVPKRKQSRSARAPTGASGIVRWQSASALLRAGNESHTAATKKATAAAPCVWVKANRRKAATNTPKSDQGAK